MAINTMQFKFEPFWVQLHNLPLATMNEEVGLQFGASIRHVIRVDTEANGLAWGKCLRVRVAVNIHRPLMRGRWLSYEGKNTGSLLNMRGCKPFASSVVHYIIKERGATGRKMSSEGKELSSNTMALGYGLN